LLSSDRSLTIMVPLVPVLRIAPGTGDRGPGDQGPGDRGPGDLGTGDWGPGTWGPGDRGPGTSEPIKEGFVLAAE